MGTRTPHRPARLTMAAHERRRRQLRGADLKAAPAHRGAVRAPRRRRASAGNRTASREARARFPRDLREPHSLAEDARRSPPAAPLPARLHRRADDRLRGTPRGSAILRRSGSRRWPGPVPRPFGGGDRSPKRTRHEGKDPPQLRDAPPRRIPKGPARHAARRKVRPARS